jgi:ribosome-associated translation inhibitor RaiA
MNPFPIRVTFRKLDRSAALEAEVRHRAEKLAPLGPDILACGVVVEALLRGWRRSKLFRVRVELAVPGDDIVLRNDVHDEDTARDPYSAVRETFDAAERRLQDRAGRLRARSRPDRRSSEEREEVEAESW